MEKAKQVGGFVFVFYFGFIWSQGLIKIVVFVYWALWICIWATLHWTSQGLLSLCINGGNKKPGLWESLCQTRSFRLYETEEQGESGGITNKERSSIYQSEAVEPCYFSSSIYFGGQEVYSPTGNSTNSQHMIHFRKDGKEDDPSGNNSSCASRGNWWQGSLYY